MKLEIAGIIHQVNGIQPLKKGFQQRVIIEQPEYKDPISERVVAYAEYFTITIFSTSQVDSRFLTPKDVNTKKKAAVYLKGERWFNDNMREYNYNHKLNLNVWVH